MNLGHNADPNLWSDTNIMLKMVHRPSTKRKCCESPQDAENRFSIVKKLLEISYFSQNLLFVIMSHFTMNLGHNSDPNLEMVHCSQIIKSAVKILRMWKTDFQP